MYALIHDKKHVRIEIKFYNLDTFKKQVDANCIDLDNLNYKVASLIFCHFWRSTRYFIHKLSNTLESDNVTEGEYGRDT